MKLSALLLLPAVATAFHVVATPAGGRLSAVRMQEDDTPTPKTPETRTSPLATFVGETTLDDFEKKKEEDNRARTALRERINIALPAITLTALGIASLIGEDKVKASLSGGGGDPFANAPGVAEAREKKKARDAKNKAEQAEFVENIQKKVRGLE